MSAECSIYFRIWTGKKEKEDAYEVLKAQNINSLIAVPL